MSKRIGKGRKRKLAQAEKSRKQARMANPGERSNYARKKAYLRRNGGSGWDYPSKPWRSSK